jgi:hypothetical protein
MWRTMPRLPFPSSPRKRIPLHHGSSVGSAASLDLPPLQLCGAVA